MLLIFYALFKFILMGLSFVITICLAIRSSWFTIVHKGVNLFLLEPNCEDVLYIDYSWVARLDDLKKYFDIWLCFGGSFFQIENAEYYCGLGISVL